MDQNFGFNSSSLGPSTPAAGLSRAARFAKVRKPSTGHRPNSNLVRPVWQPSGIESSHSNSGFDTAKPSSESSVDRGFVFGSNDGGRANPSSISSSSSLFGETVADSSLETGKVVDEMRRLNIDRGKAFSNSSHSTTGHNPNLMGTGRSIRSVDQIMDFGLPDEMRRLHIERSWSVGGGGDADHLDFELPNKMKNLNVEDSLNQSVKEKVYNARPSDVYGEEDSGNANVSAGLNATGNDTAHLRPESSLHFAAEAVKGMHAMGGESLQNVSELFNTSFNFQAGSNSSNSGSQGSLIQEQDSTSSTLGGIHFKPFGRVPEMPFVSQDEKKVEFSFTSKLGSGIPQHVEFKTPDPIGNKIFGLNRMVDTKREMAKEGGLKKKKGKWKKPNQVPTKLPQEFLFHDNLAENTESSEQYSPMDLSPYEETLADSTFSRETSVASEESSRLDEINTSCETGLNVSNDDVDDVLISATKDLHINEYDVAGNEGLNESIHYANHGIRVESPEEGAVSGGETDSFKSAADELDYSVDSFVTAAETEVSSSYSERQHSDGDQLQSMFTFSASSSSVNEVPASMPAQKKKNRVKFSHDSYSTAPSIKVSQASSDLPSFQFSGFPAASPQQGHSGHFPELGSKMDKAEQVKELGTKQDSATVSNIAVQESCEKWRLRGNQAYAKEDFSRAEDCYTQGINCISPNVTSRSCLRALMLCHSNRAATRMSLGRLREALEDCLRASTIDPNFLKAQVRAASCYLSLGEVENAAQHYMKCLQAGPEVCVDRKLLVEASEGLENTKKVAECMKQAGELLRRRTSSDIEHAVGVISEALRICTYSETLLQMKVDALLMLKKYEELIQFSEGILALVESNFLLSGCSLPLELHGSDLQRAPSFKVWCWSQIINSYFYLGKLDDALGYLKKEEESVLLVERRESRKLESMIPLVGTIRELLRHKVAGNELYKSGKYAEAVEHYTAAISCSVESRPFSAICFCNRAAAHRAMGQIIDAISDCSLAIALDGSYHKVFFETLAWFGFVLGFWCSGNNKHWN
ncbi:uncharacterized protein LOC127259674 isoform X2 [Andrographis paniculata]|uniref:uncharacterized protein LOC127259674 isoform X2 n=1 Tax=Andrographis paniculata TaxID=175694 RepID=UPI0021E86777|nr:uncharacterized protein LOC127259674 isoform X2 [Andrographis paniculata]